jgi:anti-anti-sigma factor
MDQLGAVGHRQSGGQTIGDGLLARASFAVECYETADETTVLELRGELDLAGAPLLQDQLDRVTGGVLVLDLRKLEFIDSTGLGALVRADQRLRESGGRLVLIRGSRQVQRLLEMTGIDARLEIIDQSPNGELPGIARLAPGSEDAEQ